MAKSAGQGFVGRNRAPRVQVEYETEHYGATKVVDLPFVMGVMADLSGNPEEDLPSVGERKFANVDAENFDKFLKGAKPRTSFQVPNVMTEEGGKLSVDITFESLDDFSPAAIAQKVKGLDKVYEARQQLDLLLNYVDGKDKAQDILQKILNDENVLKSLAAVSAESPAEDAGATESGESESEDTPPAE